jgi:hypothetical protein
MRTTIAFVILVTGLALGCAHRGGGGREAPREHSVEPGGDWRKLGERSVDGAHDRDVIAVGAREGAYRRIMIVVEHSPLRLGGLRSVGSAMSFPSRALRRAGTPRLAPSAA